MKSRQIGAAARGWNKKNQLSGYKSAGSETDQE